MYPERMYGLVDDERLEVEAETIVERVIDDAVETPGEPFDAIAARIKWPIEVFVFKRMEIPSAESIGEDALERVLENLDEEHADPDGDQTKPSPAMEAAALAFGKAIVADYKSWACEQTREVITFSKEKALELFPEPAAPSDMDLKGYGYAPGDYEAHCYVCGQKFIGDKRAGTCRPCAVNAVKFYAERSHEIAAPPSAPVKCGHDVPVPTCRSCAEQGGHSIKPAPVAPLTFDRFQKANAERCVEFKHATDAWSLLEWAGSAAGEMGEVANVCKKLKRKEQGVGGKWGAKDPDEATLRANLAEEIGDVLAYLALLATAAGLNLERCAAEKFDRVSDVIEWEGERLLGGPQREAAK